MTETKEFYITKEYLESIGFKVISCKTPITKINDITMNAKIYSYKNEKEFLEKDWLNDIKALDSYLFICDYDWDKYIEIQNIIRDVPIIRTFNIKEADKIIGRFFGI